MQNKHHTINNIEFPANDFSKLTPFYGEVFSWTFTEYGDDYLEFSDGNMLGGFNKNRKRQQGGPLIILYSEDLSETLTKVRKAGGKITVETFEFPGGRRFHFTDIEGNELAVWSE